MARRLGRMLRRLSAVLDPAVPAPAMDKAARLRQRFPDAPDAWIAMVADRWPFDGAEMDAPPAPADSGVPSAVAATDTAAPSARRSPQQALRWPRWRRPPADPKTAAATLAPAAVARAEPLPAPARNRTPRAEAAPAQPHHREPRAETIHPQPAFGDGDVRAARPARPVFIAQDRPPLPAEAGRPTAAAPSMAPNRVAWSTPRVISPSAAASALERPMAEPEARHTPPPTPEPARAAIPPVFSEPSPASPKPPAFAEARLRPPPAPPGFSAPRAEPSTPRLREAPAAPALRPQPRFSAAPEPAVPRADEVRPWPRIDAAPPRFSRTPWPRSTPELVFSEPDAARWPPLPDVADAPPAAPDDPSAPRVFAPPRPEHSERSWNV